MNNSIRNIATSSKHEDTTPSKRLALHHIIQRMKNPLTRNRDTTSIRRSTLQKFVNKLALSQGYSNEVIKTSSVSYSSSPTDFQKASYGSAVAKAVRGDFNYLKSLFAAGISPNPYDEDSNEFLVHTVCHNVNVAALELMIQYGGTEIVRCVDSFGRTPLHSVCWNVDKVASQDRLEIVEILLQCDPQMLYIKDCRGLEAVSYIPERQNTKWMTFFDSIKYDIWISSDIVRDTTASSVVTSSSRQQTGDIAKMLASGRMDPSEVEIFQYNHNDISTDLSCNDSKESMFFDLSCLLLNHTTDESNNGNSTNTFGESNELADILDSISVELRF